MNLNDPKAAKIYAEMPEHKRTVRITKRLIAKALRQVDHPYLACSFGKDSSVMLHLVIEQLPCIDVLFVAFEETEILNNYKEVIRWWVDHYDINLHRIETGIGSRIKSNEDAKSMTNYGDHDSYFVGIRAGESAPRRMTLKMHGVIYEMKSSGLVRICPMAYWSENDIVAYIAKHNLPSLNTYTDFGFSERTAPGVSYDDQWGKRSRLLEKMKSKYPNRYNQLINLCPELK